MRESLQGAGADVRVASFTFGQAIIPHLLKTAKDVLAKPPSKERKNPTLIFTGATMSNRSGAQFSVMAPGTSCLSYRHLLKIAFTDNRNVR